VSLNGPCAFPDEFGRHKALDLIGDLALAGLPLPRSRRSPQSRPLPTYATRQPLLAIPRYGTIHGEAARPESEAYLTALPRTRR